MRPPVVAVALFCDTVRREQGGSDTVVGIMPDNISISQVPAILPRLALYVRIQFDAEIEISPVSLSLRTPDGQNIELGTLDQETFNKAGSSAKESDKPYAGVIARTEMAPFQVLQTGRIDAIVKTATDEILAGHLTVKIVSPSSSSERPQPAEQSPSAPQPKAKKREPSRPSRRRASPKQRP